MVLLAAFDGIPIENTWIGSKVIGEVLCEPDHSLVILGIKCHFETWWMRVRSGSAKLLLFIFPCGHQTCHCFSTLERVLRCADHAVSSLIFVQTEVFRL